MLRVASENSEVDLTLVDSQSLKTGDDERVMNTCF